MTAPDSATRARPARAAARPTNRADGTGPGRRARSRADSAARAWLAGELSAAGVTYTEIAPRLGYSSPASAQRAVTRAAAARAVDHATTTRTHILPILERIITDALAEVYTDRPRTYRGRPILLNPDDPASVIIDHRPKFRAIDRALKAMDQQARLLGLYPSHPGPRISRVHPYR
jgi:hypothetical protein